MTQQEHLDNLVKECHDAWAAYDAIPLGAAGGYAALMKYSKARKAVTFAQNKAGV